MSELGSPVFCFDTPPQAGPRVPSARWPWSKRMRKAVAFLLTWKWRVATGGQAEQGREGRTWGPSQIMFQCVDTSQLEKTDSCFFWAFCWPPDTFQVFSFPHQQVLGRHRLGSALPRSRLFASHKRRQRERELQLAAVRSRNQHSKLLRGPGSPGKPHSYTTKDPAGRLPQHVSGES